MKRKLLLHVYSDIVRAFGAVRTGMQLFVILLLARWLSTKNIVASSVAQLIKKWLPLFDLCVSSLRKGHANLLCIVPI